MLGSSKKQLLITGFILALVMLIGGCVYANQEESVKAPVNSEASDTTKNTTVPVDFTLPSLSQVEAATQAKTIPVQLPGTTALNTGNTCAYPVGWYPHQVQDGENIYVLAAQYQISAEELMQGNCRTDVNSIVPGIWLYTPIEVADSEPKTYLPPGISLIAAEPAEVRAGETITLTWQSQGSIVSVRAGWVYGNQFIQEAVHLSTSGSIELKVPDDGRTSMTFMVRVSDGIQEIAAQTTVKVLCSEGWFFSPQPAGCPTAPLVTTFHEQHFERGTIVYIPALGKHYIMMTGRPVREVAETFIPGMPLRDVTMNPPAGSHLLQPEGSIFYAWRGDAAIQTTLGYAIDNEVQYTGMLQRSIENGDEVLYLLASSGHVYQIVKGKTWGVIIPQ